MDKEKQTVSPKISQSKPRDLRQGGSTQSWGEPLESWMERHCLSAEDAWARVMEGKLQARRVYGSVCVSEVEDEKSVTRSLVPSFSLDGARVLEHFDEPLAVNAMEPKDYQAVLQVVDICRQLLKEKEHEINRQRTRVQELERQSRQLQGEMEDLRMLVQVLSHQK